MPSWLVLVLVLGGLPIAIYLSVRDRDLASVDVVGPDLTITPRGLNKLWAVKARMTIPIAAITDARVIEDARELPRGWRLPGTWVPGLITAGSYVGKGEWSFFLIRGGAPVVAIEGRSGKYSRAIVETADPRGTIARIQEARKAA